MTKVSLAELQRLNVDEYQTWTDQVAVYPMTAEPHYLALGIFDELGEVGEAVCGNPTPTIHNAAVAENICAEIGDVCWYIARYLAKVLHTKFSSALIAASDLQLPGATNGVLLVIAYKAAGIIAGIEKKRIRDGDTWDEEKTEDKTQKGLQACIKILCTLDWLCRVNGFTLKQAIAENKIKLLDRKARDAIGGDGDKR